MSNTAITEPTQIPPGLRPWQPGQSGNPLGRPKKDRAFAQLVQDYLEAEDPETKELRAHSLIASLYTQALGGNTAAAKELLDRGYGKAPQYIEFDIAALAEEIAGRSNGLTPAQIIQRAQELRREIHMVS